MDLWIHEKINVFHERYEVSKKTLGLTKKRDPEDFYRSILKEEAALLHNLFYLRIIKKEFEQEVPRLLEESTKQKIRHFLAEVEREEMNLEDQKGGGEWKRHKNS